MEFEKVKESLCSVVAIPVTPFAEDGPVDFDAYGRNVRRIEAAGIDVITPNGNTGEFYSLTLQEQEEAVKTTVDAVGGNTLVVPGIGYDTETAIKMGRFAEKAGVAAVMVHQPVQPDRSERGWLKYHEQLAAALPELGIVPYIRDPAVTVEMVSALADRSPNVLGVKYAIDDPVRFAAMTQEIGNDRLAWVCGRAELWAPFLWAAGARGFTSGLVNVRPDLSLAMLTHLRNGDYEGAQRISRTIQPFEQLRARHDHAQNVSVIKEAMAQLNIGTRAVRPPTSALSDSDRRDVAKVLAAWSE